jgi:hypothetical protein
MNNWTDKINELGKKISPKSEPRRFSNNKNGGYGFTSGGLTTKELIEIQETSKENGLSYALIPGIVGNPITPIIKVVFYKNV